MEYKYYILWYSLSALAFGATWLYTRQYDSIYLRLGIRTFVFAFGFTTLPLMSPDGGIILPIAWYYFSRNYWIEAAGVATLSITVVWIVLFIIAILITQIRRKLYSRDRIH